MIQRTLTAALWDPSGPVRLSTMTVGRYFDGWLDRKAVVTVWPGGSGPRFGTLRFRLTLPSQAKATPVVLRTPGRHARTVLVRPDHSTEVAFPLFVSHPVQVEIVARQDVLLGGRVVSVQSTAPRFIESSTHP